MIQNSPVYGAGFLWYADLILSIFSLIGTFYIINFSRKVPSMSVSLRIIRAIAIADFFFSIANLNSNFQNFSNQGPNIPKRIEAWLRTIVFDFSLIFSVCIAVVSYHSETTQTHNLFRFFGRAKKIGILLSVFHILLAPMIFKGAVALKTGPVDCWIGYDSDSSPWDQFNVFFSYRGALILFGLIVTPIIYIKIFNSLRNMGSEYLERFNLQLYQLLWYPVLFFVTYLPYVIFDIVRIFYTTDHKSNHESAQDWVLWLVIILSHPIGLYNSLVFVFQRKLYKRQYEEYEYYEDEEEEPFEDDYEEQND